MTVLPVWFRTWLPTASFTLGFLILASLGFGLTSAQKATVCKKKIHDKHDLPDLTKQISEESSRYPVAHGSFGDVWKCIRKHPRGTTEARSSFKFTPVNMRSYCLPIYQVAVKCVRLQSPDDSFRTKITQVSVAPRASTTCSSTNARHRGSNTICSGTSG
ncbi:hypothetical protein BDR06DRAFT_44194 [Suillus hirtellus]|nr:hypothetical protein BDR06DRAFT_44194 [Suillus hirtellus]